MPTTQCAVFARYETAHVVCSGLQGSPTTREDAERLARRLRADARYSSVTVLDWNDAATAGWTS